jgi:hypothetical protein
MPDPAVKTAYHHSGSQSVGYDSTADGTITYTFDSAQVFLRGVRYVLDVWARIEGTGILVEKTFGVFGGDSVFATDDELRQELGNDGELWALHRTCWTPTADRTGVQYRIRFTQSPAAAFVVDDLSLSTTDNNELAGTSPRAAHCDHAHRAREIVFNGPAAGMSAGDVQDAIEELKALVGSGAFVEKANGGNETAHVVSATGATETINLANGNHQDFTLDASCTFTMPAPGRGKSFTAFVRQDGTGNRVPTFTGVEWPGGTVPEWSTDANAVDIVAFVSDAATWYGAMGSNPADLVAVLDDLTDVTITSPGAGDVLRHNGSAFVNVQLAAAGHYELLMTGSGPPEPLEDGTGTDWLYVWVN